MSETCWACDRLANDATRPVMTSELEQDDDIALCTDHWNWWLGRWFVADGEPPCSAHLADFAREAEAEALRKMREARS